MPIIRKKKTSAPGNARRKPRSLEEAEQIRIFEWAHITRMPPADDVEPGSRVSDYLFAIPNGAYLGNDPRTRAIVMNRLKRAGLKPGVHDMYLPLQRQGFAGLWIELKAGKNTATADQVAWLERMRRAGYRAEIAVGFDEAARIIADYLGIALPVGLLFGEPREARYA